MSEGKQTTSLKTDRLTQCTCYGLTLTLTLRNAGGSPQECGNAETCACSEQINWDTYASNLETQKKSSQQGRRCDERNSTLHLLVDRACVCISSTCLGR